MARVRRRRGSTLTNFFATQTKVHSPDLPAAPVVSSLSQCVSCEMEAAIGVLVSQFKAFSGADGSSDTLSKDEFQSLVKTQLPNFVKNAGDPAVIEQLMGSLDENSDGELTFLEFWQLIGHLAHQHGGFNQ